MADTTPRLALPLLQPGQSQKELFHNEALALLDLCVPAAVEAVNAAVPPTGALPGQAWALGPAPEGEWAGRTGALAGWTDGGWRFLAPVEGMAVWSRADACSARYVGGAWVVGEARVRRVLVDGVQVLGSRRPAIAAPAGGGMVDAEARTCLAALLAALEAHGLIAGV